MPVYEDAQDLASEVFARALSHASAYVAKGARIEAWLYRIARNLVVDYHRRRRRSPITPMVEGMDVPGDGDASSGLDQFDRLALVRRALQVLTPSEREVILLRFMSELSPQEVAKKLGKNSGAVRWLQHRGLARMRAYLESEGLSFT